jgi:hypothetical protein
MDKNHSGPGRPPLPEDQAAASHIHIRTTRRRKAAYVRASKPRKLTDWMVENLDKAAGYLER